MIKDFPSELPKQNTKDMPRQIVLMVNMYAEKDDLFDTV